MDAFPTADPRLSAIALYRAGAVQRRLGDAMGAATLLERAEALWSAAAETGADRLQALIEVAQAYLSQQRDRDAERAAEAAVTLARSTFERGHPQIAAALQVLGQVHVQSRAFSTAEPTLREALEIYAAAESDDASSVAVTLDLLAKCLVQQKRYDEARELVARAAALTRVGDDLALAELLSTRALLASQANKFAQAEQLLQRALAHKTSLLGRDHPSIADTLADLADLLEKTNRYAEAERHRRRVLDIREAGDASFNIAAALLPLGRNLLATGRPSEAAPMLRRTVEIYGTEDDDTLQAYGLMDRAIEAYKLMTEAEATQPRKDAP